MAAAAVIFILLAAGGYYVLLDKPAARDAVTKTQPATDVKPPETNRATITLASGETIYLDSAANGTLVKQKDMEVTKLADGRIVYKGNSTDMVFNTLTNPRGSQVIDITLSDGTRAWLNAGSSITYPVVFAGSNREVTINGEAYFEVAHNPQKPFRVGKGTMSVSVLGTHFNVNAYDDEADIKVTLLEGAVKVDQENNSKELKPGQQARINSEITITNEVNIAQVMAWKNGKFDFGEGTALTDIMRQVARWYDVDIEYRGKVEQEFWGTMSRQVNVSKVLEKFELTDRVHFKIEGKKIIVYP